MQIVHTTDIYTIVSYKENFYQRSNLWGYPYMWYKLHRVDIEHSPKLQVSMNLHDELEELYKSLLYIIIRKEKLERICGE